MYEEISRTPAAARPSMTPARRGTGPERWVSRAAERRVRTQVRAQIHADRLLAGSLSLALQSLRTRPGTQRSVLRPPPTRPPGNTGGLVGSLAHAAVPSAPFSVRPPPCDPTPRPPIILSILLRNEAS